jgi:cell division protease FtsH
MQKFWRNFYIVLAVAALCALLFGPSSGNGSAPREGEIAFSDFVAKVKAGEVASIVIKGDTVEGTLKPKPASAEARPAAKPGHVPAKEELKGAIAVKLTPADAPEKFVSRAIIYPKLLELLEEKGVKVEVKIAEGGVGLMRIVDLFGTFLWIAVLVMMFRGMRGGDRFGASKSNARMLVPSAKRVYFKDVLGIEDAKQEVAEVVDFLEDPKKYSRLGARIPKGVLLVGPPGTGKTLLARAIAGEAGVPFFSISGSDFVEMFVGVGASRVRNLFEQAKKNAPCLVFVDEIDAVGRHRGSGYGGGNDEREQTLNQLLVEMDGFEANEGIILIAATNRSDILDEALLRPGRFDRQVYISLPDLKGRAAILEKYIGEVKILSDVDAGALARGTPGFSGAELANLVNEAALIAARMNRKRITQDDFEYARDKILMGTERRSTTMSPEEVKNTAYHEAGHALCSVLLPGVDPIHKATIIPRGAALGMVQQLPERDKVSVNITEIRSQIAVAMGGRAAEEIFFGADKITAGASSDIEHATRMARNAVARFGMDDKLGPVFYGETAPMWGSHDARVNISDETARLIDSRIRAMVEAGRALAKKTILKNRKRVEELAEALLEYETLTGDEVRAIAKGGKLKLAKKAAAKKSAIRRSSSVPPTAREAKEEK